MEVSTAGVNVGYSGREVCKNKALVHFMCSQIWERTSGSGCWPTRLLTFNQTHQRLNFQTWRTRCDQSLKSVNTSLRPITCFCAQHRNSKSTFLHSAVLKRFGTQMSRLRGRRPHSGKNDRKRRVWWLWQRMKATKCHLLSNNNIRGFFSLMSSFIAES